jgi:hypothetical protein
LKEKTLFTITVYFWAFNFLSRWGLGGAHRLARAKRGLAPRVDCLSVSIKLFYVFPCEQVLEGAWGNFSKEVPPYPHPPQKSPHKRILLTIPTFFDMIKVEKTFLKNCKKILEKSVTFGTKGRVIE